MHAQNARASCAPLTSETPMEKPASTGYADVDFDTALAQTPDTLWNAACYAASPALTPVLPPSLQRSAPLVSPNVPPASLPSLPQAHASPTANAARPMQACGAAPSGRKRAVWEVQMAGYFQPYEPQQQAVLEEAYQRGEATALLQRDWDRRGAQPHWEVSLRGDTRQRQIGDKTKCRRVRRREV